MHFSRSKTSENPSQPSFGHDLHTSLKGLRPSPFLVTPNMPGLEVQALLLSKAVKDLGENVV